MKLRLIKTFNSFPLSFLSSTGRKILTASASWRFICFYINCRRFNFFSTPLYSHPGPPLEACLSLSIYLPPPPPRPPPDAPFRVTFAQFLPEFITFPLWPPPLPRFILFSFPGLLEFPSYFLVFSFSFYSSSASFSDSFSAFLFWSIIRINASYGKY